jgi:hypothetical protein
VIEIASLVKDHSAGEMRSHIRRADGVDVLADFDGQEEANARFFWRAIGRRNLRF